MDMIGQHLDVLDADWITFGNVNLEQWLLLSAKNPTQSSLLEKGIPCTYQWGIEMLLMLPYAIQINKFAVLPE